MKDIDMVKTRKLTSTKQNQHTSTQQIQNNLKCMYTNADSLLNKMDELRRDIQAKDPDIIAITEVIPKKKNRFPITKAEIIIQGYETHTNDLGTKKGRGILIYVKNNLESNEIVFKTEFQESLWITIKMNHNDKLLFGCIYRSESLPEKNNDALCALLREACIVGNNNKKFDQCIIVVDFNYKDLNWNSLSTPSKNMEQKRTNS